MIEETFLGEFFLPLVTYIHILRMVASLISMNFVKFIAY